jgi:hypothetical protein
LTDPQRCSHTTRSGQPCRAWAIRGSDPPTCSAHAGRLKGRAGAPPGNQNARTHGYYAPAVPEDQENVLLFQETSLESEILIARLLLMRLVKYIDCRRDDLDEASFSRVANLCFQALRTLTDRQISGVRSVFTPAALAEKWGVTPVTVRRWCAEGSLADRRRPLAHPRRGPRRL